jgi:hypothetical protein
MSSGEHYFLLPGLQSSMFSLSGICDSGRCPSNQHAKKVGIHYEEFSNLQAEFRRAINVLFTGVFTDFVLPAVIIIPLLPHTYVARTPVISDTPDQASTYDTVDITPQPTHRLPQNKDVTATEVNHYGVLVLA